MRKTALFWTLLLLALGLSAQPPKAREGVLDMRGFEFGSRDAVRMDGEWHILWDTLVTGRDGHDWSRAEKTAVPGLWVNAGHAGVGVATYHLLILMRPGLEQVSLKLPEFSTAYELEVNGKLMASNGVVSTDPAKVRPEYRPVTLLLHNPADSLHVLLRVANQHFHSGGVPQPLLLGSEARIRRFEHSQLIAGGVLFGILLIIGLFHMGIYLFRPKGRYNLYYSIYCLLTAFNALCVTERGLFAILPMEAWPWLYKVFISSLFVLFTSIIFFYDAFFEGLFPRWLKRTLMMMFLLQGLVTLVLPFPLATYMEPLAGLNLLLAGLVGFIMFGKAVYQKRDGAWLVSICNVLFVAVFVLSGTFTANQISGVSLTHYTTVIYVITLSFILSRRIAHAFNKVETLSGELQVANAGLVSLNQNLEKEVEQRTRQVIQQEKLAALGQLTANIAHEINTPLGAIKASIENLSISYRNSLEVLPRALERLSLEERDVLVALLMQVMQTQETPTAREERARRTRLVQQLEAEQVPDALTLAAQLSRAGVDQLNPQFITLMRREGAGEVVKLLLEQIEQISSARNIHIAIDRVGKIMFALKMYSRSGASTARSEVSLEKELQTILTLYSSWLRKGITLQTQFAEMPPLLCQAEELQQVWTNLIMNAVQAMGTSGVLEVITERRDGKALVHIANNGPEIPAEIRERIFEPFFTTKAAGEGSGLGLDIVRTIVARHGGAITVTSDPSRTCFTVAIPYP